MNKDNRNCLESVILIYLCHIDNCAITVIHLIFNTMKAPLFFWFVICLICIFSSCGKGKCYYHSEIPCGKVYGSVKKVTDTVYNVVNGEMTYPFQTSEFHFDTLNRLVEMHNCIYRVEKDEVGEEVGVSIISRQISKFRYDRNGRKVENNIMNCSYENDTVYSDSTLQRLVVQNGNSEKWEMVLIDQEGERTTIEAFWKYEKDQIIMDVIDADTQKEQHFIRVFDEQENLVEIRCVDENGDSFWRVCKYNEENQLVEVISKPLSYSDEINKVYFEIKRPFSPRNIREIFH